MPAKNKMFILNSELLVSSKTLLVTFEYVLINVVENLYLILQSNNCTTKKY